MMKYQHLPHIHLPEHYQFVTFRTADSTDTFIKKLYARNKANREKQAELDAYLDASKQGAYLCGSALQNLYQFLREKDKLLYTLVCFAIMPNHVHILFKPLKHLSVVMQGIKGASAIQLNKLLGRKGQFWARDYYDTLIRDEKHFQAVYTYIQKNPLKLNYGGAKAPLPEECDTGNGVLTPSSSQRFYGVFDD